ncbi:hypothetical protein [Streptomyces paludis]|uniref:Secreted protein n=1 Tax=Streptomyces paludis TaxID=2282738 RepID=A0A345HJY8_9ACTN|nr:hypothetical protein [Streptomyces paludis]AXG77012.1 hypothetical protein DVK44_04175 [Streptomyces paludis]
MQISDAPDHAHARPRAVHWLATGAALSAVVALAALSQPGAATAIATPPGEPSVKSAGTTAPAVQEPPDPAAVDFPLDCGEGDEAGTVIVQRAYGDLDGDGVPETVVAVRCRSGAGTPPSGVYVLTGAGGEPRIVATLVDPAERRSVAPGLAVHGRAILATLLGYSGPDVPSCCPDEEERTSWTWRDGAFVRGPQPVARGM